MKKLNNNKSLAILEILDRYHCLMKKHGHIDAVRSDALVHISAMMAIGGSAKDIAKILEIVEKFEK